jgi:ABC-2 type transport system permease protein
MTVLALAGVSLRRVARDRTALFFMVVLPVVIILVIGVSVRGYSTFRVGLVDLGAGRAGHELTLALERASDLQVHAYPSDTAAAKGVARSEVNTAVILPAGLDEALRSGRSADIAVLAERTDSTQQAAATAVTSVITRVGARVQAAVFATRTSGTFDQNLARATGTQLTLSHVGVHSKRFDTRADVLPAGFSYSAPTMLVLFVFVNGLAAGAVIIETRRLGMYERMGASPMRIQGIIAGEALAYLCIALVQAMLIVAVGAVVFGVSWGDPLAAGTLIVVWALVGTGAGLLSGTVFHTPEQATAVGPALGIALAMLGGCMWPLSIVSSTMRQIGHATPQAWAVDAWTALLARHGTLSSIGTELAVLGGFAIVLLALATSRLRRTLATS